MLYRLVLADRYAEPDALARISGGAVECQDHNTARNAENALTPEKPATHCPGHWPRGGLPDLKRRKGIKDKGCHVSTRVWDWERFSTAPTSELTESAPECQALPTTLAPSCYTSSAVRLRAPSSPLPAPLVWRGITLEMLDVCSRPRSPQPTFMKLTWMTRSRRG